MLNPRYRQPGASLIELTIALVIIGILFAVGAPAFRIWIQNSQIRAAAESILNGIQVARNEAVKNNGQARFALCGTVLPSGARNSSWEVLAASATAPAPAASLACGALSGAVTGDARVQERSSQEGSQAVQVSSSGVASIVTFNGFGRVMANADLSASITQLAVSAPAGDRALQINVGVAGNTRMCDPSPLLVATDPRHC